jgi:hypothetical protein
MRLEENDLVDEGSASVSGRRKSRDRQGVTIGCHGSNDAPSVYSVAGLAESSGHQLRVAACLRRIARV